MSSRVLRIGFFADAVWKALVGIAMLGLFRPLVDGLGAPGWLLALTAMLVLASAVTELMYAVRNGSRTHTTFLIAYDAGWALASAAALVLAAVYAEGGWILWLGYQLGAAPIIAVLFARGARRESAIAPPMNR